MDSINNNKEKKKRSRLELLEIPQGKLLRTDLIKHNLPLSIRAYLSMQPA